jgi:hypothetical protein
VPRSLTLLALFVLLFAARASAEPLRRVLVHADGARAAATRSEAQKALPTGIGPAVQPGYAKALGRTGIKSIGAALAAHTDRAALAAKLLGALDAGKADAVVIAHPLGTKKGETRMWVIVAVRGEGAPRLDDTVLFAALASSRQQTWQRILSSALAPKPQAESAKAEPPKEEPVGGAPVAPAAAAPEPVRVADVVRTAENEPIASEPAPPPPPWLVAHAEGVFAERAWEHDDAQYGTTRRYTAAGVLGAAGGVEIYPFAHAEGGVLRDVGLEANGFTAPGLQSSGPGGAAAATTWYAWSAALRARLRPGKTTVGFALGYGQSVFDYAVADEADRETPRGRYRMLRAGADVRVPVGPVAFTLGVTGLHVLSASHLSTYGPAPSSAPGHPDALGVEASLGIAVRIAGALDVRAGGRYARVQYRADTWPTASGKPGSVRDQTFAGTFGVGLTF